MEDARLIAYIKLQLSKGVSLEQIRQKLISVGWQEYYINQAIGLVKQQTESNEGQTQPSYKEIPKESSNSWILLASGVFLIISGILTLSVLVIKEMIT
ncbi:MAG: hypothetical protein IIB81_00190 [Nanoarchaeota archaeon]|nr:hypothetical protein [Nanoarchaeota archaeon]